jgi:hypothetical protein
VIFAKRTQIFVENKQTQPGMDPQNPAKTPWKQAKMTQNHFKAGSINVGSVAGSSRFRIVIGSTVTITSSVGDT